MPSQLANLSKPKQRVTLTVATATNPGAVGLIQLQDEQRDSDCHTGTGAVIQNEALVILREITGVQNWPLGKLRLVSFADIDTGLAVRLKDGWIQLMPHGGPRVIQKLLEALTDLGAQATHLLRRNDISNTDSHTATHPNTRALFPEAQSDIEADALYAISHASSPMAIDLLLHQQAAWTQWLSSSPATRISCDQIHTQSIGLNHLITPPSVVVIGRPNVGKSTLTNYLHGKTVSLASDLPGTTRDWVAGIVELTAANTKNSCTETQSDNKQLVNQAWTNSVAVKWTDTPGIRESDDKIEQQAITLAKQVLDEATILIVLRDPQTDWPDESILPREPDLWVMNKADSTTDQTISVSARKPIPNVEATSSTGCYKSKPLQISAKHGFNIEQLEQMIILKLGLDVGLRQETPSNSSPTLWCFSPLLQRAVHEENISLLKDYLENTETT